MYKNRVISGDPDMEDNIYRNEIMVRRLPPVPAMESDGPEDMGTIESCFRKNWSIASKLSLLGLITLLSMLLIIVCALYPAASPKIEEGIRSTTQANVISEPMTHICPFTWIKSGDSCYFFSTSSENWQDAFTACASMESKLLTLTSREEMNSLLPRMNGKAYWSGLMKYKFQWIWIDGTPYTFSYWNPNEPNNLGGKEKCVEMKSDGWNDLNCDTKNHYICKK